jgi:2'-5' RNA ligase
MSQLSYDVTTALTLVIPDEFVTKINEVRSKYDKAYVRWMPHINFIFPFVESSEFDNAEVAIKKELSNIKPFNLTLDEIGYFAQGKNLTVHIKTKDDSDMKKLFVAVKKALPNVQIKHDEFHPHLTIAQIPKQGSQKQIDQFEKWLGDGFTFKVNKVFILQRSKTDTDIPFHVEREILL